MMTYTIPSYSQNVTVTTHGKDVTVKWNPPISDGGLEVYSYSIDMVPANLPADAISPRTERYYGYHGSASSNSECYVISEDNEFDLDYIGEVRACNAAGASAPVKFSFICRG